MVRYAAPPTPPLCDNLILTASTGERERESSTEEVSDDDVEREKVRAKEQYMNELQEQRDELLHQQTLERQQQQWQEERDDASGGESKPAQRTSGKTLLDKERERLLQQQQQQQQQEGHVEERGNRQSQINVESVTNSQQSLYDSGREEQPENADRGIRESGEDGDSGEKGRDGGTPGARGEGGDLGAGGEDVRWEREGREGEGESEDRTCDSQTPGDCPEIKDGT